MLLILYRPGWWITKWYDVYYSWYVINLLGSLLIPTNLVDKNTIETMQQ